MPDAGWLKNGPGRRRTLYGVVRWCTMGIRWGSVYGGNMYGVSDLTLF